MREYTSVPLEAEFFHPSELTLIFHRPCLPVYQ